MPFHSFSLFAVTLLSLQPLSPLFLRNLIPVSMVLFQLRYKLCLWHSLEELMIIYQILTMHSVIQFWLCFIFALAIFSSWIFLLLLYQMFTILWHRLENSNSKLTDTSILKNTQYQCGIHITSKNWLFTLLLSISFLCFLCHLHSPGTLWKKLVSVSFLTFYRYLILKIGFLDGKLAFRRVIYPLWANLMPYNFHEDPY